MGQAHLSSDQSRFPSDWREFFQDSGVRYGLMVGLIMFGVGQVVPARWVWTIFWAFLFIQAIAGAVIVWRRLRLRYFASASVATVMFSGAILLYTWRGYTPAMIVRSEPWPILALMAVAVLLVPLSIEAERAVNTPAWQAWTRRMKEKPSIWQMLTFRHVPDLRTRSF